MPFELFPKGGSILSGSTFDPAQKVGTLAKTVASSTAGGLGSNLMGLLGGPWGAAISAIPMIAGLFKRSQAGQQKVDATMSQQDAEKWVKSIQSQVDQWVQSGGKAGMEPTVALKALNQMQAGLNTGGNTAQGNAMMGVNNLIAQVKANVQAQVNNQMQKGFSPEPLSGDQNAQRMTLLSALRNMAGGTEMGKTWQQNSPLGKLFQSGPDFATRFGDMRNLVRSEWGDMSADTGGMKRLGSQIQDQLAKYRNPASTRY